jgi:hypothetical protein
MTSCIVDVSAAVAPQLANTALPHLTPASEGGL